jgi:hypothetical protein
MNVVYAVECFLMVILDGVSDVDAYIAGTAWFQM